MNGKKMPDKATTPEDIRRLCSPAPLEGKMMRYFMETDSARDSHQNTRQLLKQALESENDVRILFYGHRGCGKSTELNKLLGEVAETFLPVKFDVQTEMPPLSMHAEDLILVILERVFDTLNTHEISVDEHILKGVYDYFAQTTEITEKTREATMQAGAGVDTGNSVLGNLCGLFATFRSDIKAGGKSESTSVRELRKRPGELLVQANLILGSARNGLKDTDQRLLVVIEGLDKVGIEQARELFIENVKLLTGLDTDIVYTIPIWLFHSPDAGAFTPSFDETIGQPMIKVRHPGGEPAEEADVVKKIVMARLADSAIEEEAVDLLVDKTGGVLRHAFQVLHTAAAMSDVAIPLACKHIRYGLDKLRQELARQVTLPRDNHEWGDLTVSGLFDRLQEYAQLQESGNPIPIVSDPANQILLQSCALVEYNGEGWLGVHPLIVEHLEKMGRLGE